MDKLELVNNLLLVAKQLVNNEGAWDKILDDLPIAFDDKEQLEEEINKNDYLSREDFIDEDNK